MLCKTNTVLSHKTNVTKCSATVGGFLMITALMLVLKYHIEIPLEHSLFGAINS